MKRQGALLVVLLLSSACGRLSFERHDLAVAGETPPTNDLAMLEPPADLAAVDATAAVDGLLPVDALAGDLRAGSDLSAIDAPSPADLAVAVDAAATVDLALAQDLVVGADLSSPPDLRPEPLHVTLDQPLAGATTSAVEVSFIYHLSPGESASACELRVDGAIPATQPTTAGKFVATGLADGAHTWNVTCTDAASGRQGASEQRALTIGPESLAACKTSAWQGNTRYRLTGDLLAGGDCLVVRTSDVSGSGPVVIDGAAHSLTAGKSPDLFVNGPEGSLLLLGRPPGSGGALYTDGWSGAQGTYQAADLDGDGDLDLIRRSYTSDLIVYESTGGQLLARFQTRGGGTMGFDPVHVLDFDLDGKIDFFAGHDGASETLFRNTGSLAGFATAWSAALGTYTHHLDLGDWDGDGRVDVITGNNDYYGTEDRHHVVLNRSTPGAGSFQLTWQSSERATWGNSQTADLNGDGKADLLVPTGANSASGASVVYLGDGSGGFQRKTSIPGTHPLDVADVDGDGDSDLVLYTVDGDWQGAAVWLNDGGASFTLGQAIDRSSSGRVAGQWCHVADLDGDGDEDLVLSGGSGYTGGIEVLANDGKGRFSTAWTSSAKGSFGFTRVRDLDGDGDLDIVTARSAASGNAAQEILVFLQTASLSFSQAWQRSATSASGRSIMALGDVDGAVMRGLVIAAPDVRVRGFSDIRGFSVGVDVTGERAELRDLRVGTSDLYGVRFTQVSSGTIDRVVVGPLPRGVGLGVFNSHDLTVSDSRFCDGHPDHDVTVLGSYCVGASSIKGSGNRVQLNNGCPGLDARLCR